MATIFRRLAGALFFIAFSLLTAATSLHAQSNGRVAREQGQGDLKCARTDQSLPAFMGVYLPAHEFDGTLSTVCFMPDEVKDGRYYGRMTLIRATSATGWGGVGQTYRYRGMFTWDSHRKRMEYTIGFRKGAGEFCKEGGRIFGYHFDDGKEWLIPAQSFEDCRPPEVKAKVPWPPPERQWPAIREAQLRGTAMGQAAQQQEHIGK